MKNQKSNAGMFDDPNASITAGPGDAPTRREKQPKPAKRAKKVPAVEQPAAPEPPPELDGRVVTEQEAFEKANKELDAAEAAVKGLPMLSGVVEGAPFPAIEHDAKVAMTREGWLIAGVAQMTPLFVAKGYKVPPVRVSCGWPSTKGLSSKGRHIGECWAAEASADGVSQIFISPFLDQKVTPAAVLATLVHEVVHAVVGMEAKHGAPFKKCAKAMGLEGKMTATVAGPDLAARIGEWEKHLGPYPHASLDALKRPTKKQGTRMLKAECSECGFTVRLAKKWIEEVGWPHCPKHGAMTGELPTDETKEDSEEGGGDED